MGYLVDHKSSFWPGELERVLEAGKTLGLEVILLTAEQAEEIEPALGAAKPMGIGAGSFGLRSASARPRSISAGVSALRTRNG